LCLPTEKDVLKLNSNIVQIFLLLIPLLILALFLFNSGIVYGSEQFSQIMASPMQYKLVNQTTNLTNILKNSKDNNFLSNIKNYSGTIDDGVSKLFLVIRSLA